MAEDPTRSLGTLSEPEISASMRENLEKLEAAIEGACRSAGRSAKDVELMAVSKTYPVSTIAAAASLGLRLFGENRVQEFASKALHAAALRELCGTQSLRVHLIGHLQSNKAARAVGLFDAIDSLDSLRLAERLNDAAARLNKRLPVLLEVKLSAEENKEGLDPEGADTAALLDRLTDLEHLHMQGLMTIAPWGVPDDQTRACFRALREIRDRWAAAHPRLSFDVLSMGMSGDFPIAIEEGATRIRIGTAIFGKRKPYTGPQ